MFRTGLGDAIRNRRLEMGFSQEEVAADAGVHRTYLSDVERGGRNITIGVLVRLAAALDIEIWRLIKQAETAKK